MFCVISPNTSPGRPTVRLKKVDDGARSKKTPQVLVTAIADFCNKIGT